MFFDFDHRSDTLSNACLHVSLFVVINLSTWEQTSLIKLFRTVSLVAILLIFLHVRADISDCGNTAYNVQAYPPKLISTNVLPRVWLYNIVTFPLVVYILFISISLYLRKFLQTFYNRLIAKRGRRLLVTLTSPQFGVFVSKPMKLFRMAISKTNQGPLRQTTTTDVHYCRIMSEQNC